MQKDCPWPYKRLKPLKIPAGKYQIWIFARETPGPAHSPGKSGCAWEIRDENNNIVSAPEPQITENQQSSQWRGYIAAMTRGLEQLPDDSEVIICSEHKTILAHIEAIDIYKEREWKNRQGKPVEDADIWRRCLSARDGDNETRNPKTVTTRKAASEPDKAIIKQLKKVTVAAMDGASSNKKINKQPKKRK